MTYDGRVRPEPDAKLRELAFSALNVGIESVRKGRPFIPLVLQERGGEREVVRFLAERLETAVLEAFEHASNELGDCDRVAVAYDGYLTSDATGVVDAIQVEAAERGQTDALLIAQLYVPRRGFRRTEPIGNPIVFGHDAKKPADRPYRLRLPGQSPGEFPPPPPPP